MTSREDVSLLDKQKVAIPFIIQLIFKYGETIRWCESSI